MSDSIGQPAGKGENGDAMNSEETHADQFFETVFGRLGNGGGDEHELYRWRSVVLEIIDGLNVNLDRAGRVTGFILECLLLVPLIVELFPPQLD